MNKTINIKNGIYDTCYKLRENKDNSINVRIPYIKWINNTGYLKFNSVKYTGNIVKLIKIFFKANKLVIDPEEQEIFLSDVLNYNYGVKQIEKIIQSVLYEQAYFNMSLK